MNNAVRVRIEEDGEAMSVVRALGVRVAFPFLIGSLTLLVAVLIWASIKPEPFDPLEYSVQRIEFIGDDGVLSVPRVAEFARPAVDVSEVKVVPARGDRTNTADRTISTRGTVVWEQVDPAGFRVAVIEGANARIQPGTGPIYFENEIPDSIVARVTGGGPDGSLWRITGVVDVLEPNGVSVTWTTETFRLVP